MSNKTRNLLKLVAIIIVVICVLMQLDIVVIKGLVEYTFWLMVIAFGMVLFTSR